MKIFKGMGCDKVNLFNIELNVRLLETVIDYYS